MFIYKVPELVKEYNNILKRIKIKPADVKPETYINLIAEINTKNPKFKVGDHMCISKYKKNILFKRVMHQICQKNYSRLNKLKEQHP